MISEDKFMQLVQDVLKINISNNNSQKEAILANLDENQYIVAGPGSGKTTVLVLKILKYILVDDIELDNIIVTTFTKKAAKELKDRMNKWYSLLTEELGMENVYDFNTSLIGTLDSIAEEILSDYSDVDVIDNFTSSAIMMQNLLAYERNKDKRLKQFIKQMNNNASANTSEMNSKIQTIRELIYYNLIDYESLKSNADREIILFDIIDDYTEQLNQRAVIDYAMLEKKFYEILLEGSVEKLSNISVLLIDEYQDTNFLQEQIYFKMVEYVKANNGNVTVVGDDDQSLYRFRGATISLFTDYVNRISEKLSITPKTIFLQENYRSTKAIIDFANEFIGIDSIYQKSRASNKPPILSTEDTLDGLPVLGMFRNNLEELSTDLTNLLYDLKVGNPIEITRHGKTYEISAKKSNPSIAVLTNSPKEISAYSNKRLPFYIRESLSYKDDNIAVFNPRGQSIETTDIVSLICGLILLSIDPKSTTDKQLDTLPPHTKSTMKSWRKYANQYLEEENKQLVTCEDRVNMVELLTEIERECTSLISDSNENAIYHEIIIETILQTDSAINEDGLLTSKQVFWHILVPIASGAIDIDDDMFDVSLEDNINIMSIHQSKGLEFDVVVVDVGSDIFNNSTSSSFKRFPRNGGVTYNMEEYLNDYSTMGTFSDDASALDKAFNDLIRRYFVAYTRGRSILVLVGLNSMRYGFKGDFQNKIFIENVATGWSRDKVWHWDSLNNLLHI